MPNKRNSPPTSQKKNEGTKMPNSPRHHPPTSTEVVAEQYRRTNFRQTPATSPQPAPVPTVPAKVTGTNPVTVPDTRSTVQKYLDSTAPASIAGRLVKFSKDGRFVTSDDGEPIDSNAKFIALCDETLVGWIKFNGENSAPYRVQGLLYRGFEMPERATLGDLDETQWAAGLDGRPEDPWRHQICLVLQNTDTHVMYTFATASPTGRTAAINLLRHYDRVREKNPDELPVVSLKAGGYKHRKFGWVATPTFTIVGRTTHASAAKADTSPAGDMNDEVPLL